MSGGGVGGEGGGGGGGGELGPPLENVWDNEKHLCPN